MTKTSSSVSNSVIELLPGGFFWVVLSGPKNVITRMLQFRKRSMLQTGLARPREHCVVEIGGYWMNRNPRAGVQHSLNTLAREKIRRLGRNLRIRRCVGSGLGHFVGPECAIGLPIQPGVDFGTHTKTIGV